MARLLGERDHLDMTLALGRVGLWSLALAAVALRWPAPWTFLLTAVALASAARLLGDATEDAAVHSGPRVGGLLNATLGGATALCIAAFAVHLGLFELAKASIVGAVIANLLLVLGAGIFIGGLRHGTQYFDRSEAGLSGTMMILAVIALAVPALFGQHVQVRNVGPVESLSEAVATVMIAVYLLSLYYSLVWNLDEQAIAGVHRDEAKRGLRRSAFALVAALAAVVVFSRLLVGASATLVSDHGWGAMFVGVVALPLVGSVAQHTSAVEQAWRNRMDRCTTIAIGAGLHLFLFVTPLLVFLSLLVGHPMDLIFGTIELVAMGAAALVAALVALDGESHWLEGAMLLAVYLLFGLAFYWWPAIGAAVGAG